MLSENRRAFVKRSFVTALISFLNPLEIFSREKVTFPLWEDLVEIARWCPTVHNLQPHKLKVISEDTAELYYDPSRLLPVGDPKCIFTTIAMGVFIEHLNIAAKSRNMKVDLIKFYLPIQTNSNGLTLFAKLKLAPNSLSEELPSGLIFKRKTSRVHYDEKVLTKRCIERLSREASGFGHQFHLTTDKRLVEDIILLNQQTLFHDIESEADRKELDHLFRYTKEEASTKKDGLWSRCMGFPGVLIKSVFHHHQFWDKGIEKNILASHYRSSFKGTTTICWFTGRFSNTEDWLQCGRLLARSWLIITQEGGYIQPFGSLITNVEAYKKINEKFEGTTGENKIWMIFRAGYSKEPVRSFRLDTSEIVFK